MEPMRKGKDGLLVFSHSGYLWGSTAFMMLDEHGGVFVWVVKGSPKAGSSDFDDLKWNFYDMLSVYYQQPGVLQTSSKYPLIFLPTLPNSGKISRLPAVIFINHDSSGAAFVCRFYRVRLFHGPRIQP